KILLLSTVFTFFYKISPGRLKSLNPQLINYNIVLKLQQGKQHKSATQRCPYKEQMPEPKKHLTAEGKNVHLNDFILK
ncbi:MAG TPA: hypothetical protein VF610_08085, partial [Segetibacter sp.]